MCEPKQPKLLAMIGKQSVLASRCLPDAAAHKRPCQSSMPSGDRRSGSPGDVQRASYPAAAYRTAPHQYRPQAYANQVLHECGGTGACIKGGPLSALGQNSDKGNEARSRPSHSGWHVVEQQRRKALHRRSGCAVRQQLWNAVAANSGWKAHEVVLEKNFLTPQALRSSCLHS